LVGAILLGFGLIAALYDVRVLQNLGLGWGSTFFGILFLVIARGLVAIRDIGNTSANEQSTSGISSATSAAPISTSNPSSSGPRSVSFVGIPQSGTTQPGVGRLDVLSKSLTPEILNLRFVAYRCEISPDHLKAVYQMPFKKSSSGWN
jgi:hypothetical protein